MPLRWRRVHMCCAYSLAPRRRRRILDLDAVERNVHGARVLLDRLGVAEQDRIGDAVLDADARGANDLRLFALGEHDALRVARPRD